MSIMTPPSSPPSTRRIWQAPAARTRWLWLVLASLLSLGIFIWYLYALRTEFIAGAFKDPLRFFGFVAFVLVLATVAYSLRRRFMRNLPGMARDWLEMHIWLGIAAVIIAMLHTKFAFLSDCTDLHCITQYSAGSSALIALIVLVVSGIFGRLLDFWQAHIIAREASTNGVGIVQSVEEHLLELEYTVERLCAGKSEAFKQYCLVALSKAKLPASQPKLAVQEALDYHRANTTLTQYVNLTHSLRRQKRAKSIMSLWRQVHILIATFALMVIGLHSGVEILKVLLKTFLHR